MRANEELSNCTRHSLYYRCLPLNVYFWLCVGALIVRKWFYLKDFRWNFFFCYFIKEMNLNILNDKLSQKITENLICSFKNKRYRIRPLAPAQNVNVNCHRIKYTKRILKPLIYVSRIANNKAIVWNVKAISIYDLHHYYPNGSLASLSTGATPAHSLWPDTSSTSSTWDSSEEHN